MLIKSTISISSFGGNKSKEKILVRINLNICKNNSTTLVVSKSDPSSRLLDCAVTISMRITNKELHFAGVFLLHDAET